MFEFSLNSKVVAMVFLATALVVGSLGISHHGMGMDMDSNHADCPFLPGVSICSMSPFEMIAAAQSLFHDVTYSNDLYLLLSLLTVAASMGVLVRFLSPPTLLVFRQLPLKNSPPFSYSFLEEAFASGILNPKLY